MYRFHYDVIKERYGDHARLLFTDTDSLCYHIRCDDFYKDMMQDRHLYDLSNYPADSPCYDPVNKKVLGKFKDECEGTPVLEFVGLRPKMYSLKISATKQKGTAKGVPKNYRKKHITHADYHRCLFSKECVDRQQMARFSTIRSKKHKLATLEINKVGLCCFDNKRYLWDDGVTSYSYGHHRI
eukprot:COSAG01_NODE_7397_length_3224_cov_1.757120_2_plen_183_part_00